MATLSVQKVRHAKVGRHADGAGLYLLVKPTGARSWVLRVQVEGRRRDIGLGAVAMDGRAPGANDPNSAIPILERKMLSLAEAREKAGILRNAAKAGRDPVVERDGDHRQTRTFREAAVAAHSDLKGGWTENVAKSFLRSLELHVFTSLGDKRVDRITAADVIDVLKPIWTTKPDLARKVRQRVRTVLNFANGKGWRPHEAPSKAISSTLGRQPKGSNYVALEWENVPQFAAIMAGDPVTTGRCGLLFQILTAARPGEVRRAKWGQIDFHKREWNRPPSIMKNGQPHMVTLSDAAIDLLLEWQGDRKVGDDDLIFPGVRGMLSDMTFSKVITTAGYMCDAHGFRSSFRDWAAEEMPAIPDAVAEAALAHVVSDAVIAAYKRTKFNVMRRTLLNAWGAYATSQCPALNCEIGR